jgi:16S rRNA (adenine1518-N6/adenine1519-N6)-dimethyltransferase
MPIPKKSLGQNFLMHARIAERMVHASGIGEGSTVLEIGPGTGMLTRALFDTVPEVKVVAVEADESLIAGLEEKFSSELQTGRLTLIYADVRNFDPGSISGDYGIVANIPYYITGEILRQFLGAKHKPQSMTVLVQREVAARVARGPKESILSLSVKVYGTPKYCFTVPRGAFFPAPNVDSAVLSIQNIDQNVFGTGTADQKAEIQFFEMIKAGFGQKRKKLSKNLELLYSREKIEAAFETLKINPDTRSEDLALADWKNLLQLFTTQ